MAQESKDSTGLPLAGILAVLLGLSAAYLFRDVTLRGSRPDPEERRSETPAQEERVEARLWEDPYSAIERFRKKSSADKGRSSSVLLELPIPSVGSLADEVQAKLADSKVRRVIV